MDCWSEVKGDRSVWISSSSICYLNVGTRVLQRPPVIISTLLMVMVLMVVANTGAKAGGRRNSMSTVILAAETAVMRWRSWCCSASVFVDSGQGTRPVGIITITSGTGQSSFCTWKYVRTTTKIVGELFENTPKGGDPIDTVQTTLVCHSIADSFDDAVTSTCDPKLNKHNFFLANYFVSLPLLLRASLNRKYIHTLERS